MCLPRDVPVSQDVAAYPSMSVSMSLIGSTTLLRLVRRLFETCTSVTSVDVIAAVSNEIVPIIVPCRLTGADWAPPRRLHTMEPDPEKLASRFSRLTEPLPETSRLRLHAP